MLAIIPLAERLGYLTEQLALHTNETLGGLLNATFGNAVETLISITALQKAQEAQLASNEVEVSFFLTLIQTSLLGSMLSNLLLVQGSAFFVGGLKHSVQKFSRDGAITSAGLLVLCTLGLGVPSMMWSTQTEWPLNKQLALSRFVSGCLLFIYSSFLIFQLKTHRFLFEGGSNKVHQAKLETALDFATSVAPRVAIDEVVDEEMHRRGDDARSHDDLISDAGSVPEEEAAPDMGFVPALFWLAFSTVGVAFVSEVVVAAAQGAVEGLGVSALFIGGIVVPVVGNAAEHVSALMFAYRDRMDVAIGVSVGSAIQIPLFVYPVCVLVGWAMEVPLTLNLPVFMMSIIVVVTLAMAFTLHAGSSHWLHGLMLIVEYIIIACSFWLV